MMETLATFLPRFLAALGVNFGIAGASVLCGLALGLPLAAARMAPGPAARAAHALVGVLRAAPTFVVMFFLLNALPRGVAIGDWHLGMTPWLAVMLSLAIYATAYVSDNALDAAQQWRQGSRLAAWLFPMGLARAFFVIVLSSGFGAAVGVVEATTVTLRQIEALDGTDQRLALMALVVALYVAVFQLIYLLIEQLRQRLLTRLRA